MNLENMSSRDQLTVFLVIATILTSSYAAYVAANYFQFYPAIEHVQLRITRLDWTSNNTSLDAMTVFTVENPSGYKGISLRAFESFLNIQLNGTVKIPQPLPSIPASGPLIPKASIKIAVPFQGATDAPTQVTETLERGGTVEFVFYIELTLGTFLDNSASFVDTYQCTSPRGPATCEQTGIHLRGVTTAIAPGGGGS